MGSSSSWCVTVLDSTVGSRVHAGLHCCAWIPRRNAEMTWGVERFAREARLKLSNVQKTGQSAQGSRRHRLSGRS